MKSKKQANYEQAVVELRKKGHSLRELGRRFLVARSEILLLLRQPGLREDLEEEATTLLFDVRNANDLHRPWPTVRLIAALGLDYRGTQCLENHFKGESSICLDDFLDFLLPDVSALPRTVTHVLPTYHANNYGVTSYAATVSRLLKLDLGKAFRSKLEERCGLLFRARIKTDLRLEFRRFGVL